MASGRLAKSNPTADTVTTVYTCPAGLYSVITVALLNYTDSATTFKLSIVDSANATPTIADYIEYDSVLSSKNVIERTGLVLSAGQKIVVTSPTSGCIVNVYGIETQA
jgi:hypothetical protein